MTALETLLDGALDATVLRDAPQPESVPADGLVILRAEGGPADPIEVQLSPLAYTFAHPVALEIYVQAGTGRDAAFDAIKVAIGTAIGGDRTLSGAVEWVEMSPPEEADEPFMGAAPIKTGLVPLTLTYTTSNPLT